MNNHAENEHLVELRRREIEITRQIGRLTHGTPRDDHWVSIEDIRKTLPSGTVFLQIVKCPIRNLKEYKRNEIQRPPRYLAWAIPPANEGHVTLVDLGETSPIDSAVAEGLDAMYSIRRIASAAEMRASGKDVMKKTRTLAKLIWDTMPAVVHQAKALIINPDGSLWLFPWEALPVDENTFLVEQKQISYVVSGRDFAAKQDRLSNRGSEALLFVDPDYDMQPPRTPSTHANAAKREQSYLGQINMAGLLTGLKCKRLPSAATEAELFPSILQDYTNSKSIVYARQHATEKAFKKIKNPRVLVLSTHGFFLGNPVLDNMPLTTRAKQRLMPLVLQQLSTRQNNETPILIDPLFRCGLALAGANHHDRANAPNDGILTGAEILAADLKGTELVILSACDTGVGTVQNGEGIAGLRHAFQLAGAKTIVAALWSVPDKGTHDLMKSFLQNLAQKQGTAEALRNSQLTLIKSLRTQFGGAHPGFWAGFTLTGKWR